jgi:hypothetical protein
MAYVWTQRTRHGIRLILNTALTLSQIADLGALRCATEMGLTA